MNRRQFLLRSAALGSAGLPFGLVAKEPSHHDAWRALLDKDAFHILFKEGTERAFTSPLLAEKRTGTFICAACYQPLFSSSAKYKSGTGWPSFFESLKGAVDTKRDYGLWTPRTEYHCSHCGGHQGHVFDDGPKPSGKRYCNNGLALNFVPQGDSLPAIREAL